MSENLETLEHDNGCIHKNFSIDDQVKKYDLVVISDYKKASRLM